MNKNEFLSGFPSLKNTDFIDIRSFVIVFVLYSLISIFLAHLSVRNDERINVLNEREQILKSEYVISKTTLMKQRKSSYLLEKASFFGFYPSINPIKTISLEYEN